MSMRSLVSVGATLISSVLAQGAAAQAPASARERARETLSPPTFSVVDALAQSLAGEGIPAEAVYGKALEGTAKGVSAERLTLALEAYAGRLRAAHGAFGRGAQAALTVAGADALQRGVDVASLRALGEDEGRSPMAVVVLADLVETGVPADRAVDLVREALRQRTRERELLDMPARVRVLIRDGASARDAAEQVRRTIQRRRGGGVTAPVAPGSEPLTTDRLRRLDRRGG